MDRQSEVSKKRSSVHTAHHPPQCITSQLPTHRNSPRHQCNRRQDTSTPLRTTCICMPRVQKQPHHTIHPTPHRSNYTLHHATPPLHHTTPHHTTPHDTTSHHIAPQHTKSQRTTPPRNTTSHTKRRAPERTHNTYATLPIFPSTQTKPKPPGLLYPTTWTHTELTHSAVIGGYWARYFSDLAY